MRTDFINRQGLRQRVATKKMEKKSLKIHLNPSAVNFTAFRAIKGINGTRKIFSPLHSYAPKRQKGCQRGRSGSGSVTTKLSSEVEEEAETI